MFSEIGFQPFGKFAPREQDVSPAAFTFESDIGAETYDGPFVGAARMLFTEAQVIVELEFGEHGFIKVRDEM